MKAIMWFRNLSIIFVQFILNVNAEFFQEYNFGIKNCMYLIDDKNSDINELSTGLKNKQIISIKVQENNKIKILHDCGSYIFASNNATRINFIFSHQNINIYFKPHKVVILITNKSDELNLKQIEITSKIHDLNLTIIQSSYHRNGQFLPTVIANF